MKPSRTPKRPAPAAKRRSPCPIACSLDLFGDKWTMLVIRDLALGAQLAASTKDRADYLELRQRAQFSVSEAQLVDAVKEVLGR
jgi:DNA-binding HxlR family transcriptional regulator